MKIVLEQEIFMAIALLRMKEKTKIIRALARYPSEGHVDVVIWDVIKNHLDKQVERIQKMSEGGKKSAARRTKKTGE